MRTIRRGLTAIHRVDFSRPILLALDDGVVDPHRSVFDYGCGRGGDIQRLRKTGIEAHGWDPEHQPNAEIRPADIVNFGFVVNVIEDPRERAEALTRAWSLARQVLIVSARLTFEARDLNGQPHGDGVLTKKGTFQKFYEQNELRDWIDQLLQVESVAAAPGVFYVFRDQREKETFLAWRQHTALSVPRVRRSDALFDQHKGLLQGLVAFVAEWGRLPHETELDGAAEIMQQLGSIRRAFGIIKRATASSDWKEVRKRRSEDLLVFLALARFRKRPQFSHLPESIQRDVKAFFSSYTQACKFADDLLYGVGDGARLMHAFAEASVGKQTDRALYIHIDALSELPPLLRVYAGCAQAYLGTVEDANVLKLHKLKPAVTFMAYPDFEDDPHPTLAETLRVELHTFDIKMRDFSTWGDRPILHEKERYVPPNDPNYERFARLSQKERQLGLLDESSRANTQRAWEALLDERGLKVKNHEIVSRK